MQAHHLVTIPMVTTIVGCVLKIIVTYVFVGKPEVNIKGGPVSTLVCFGVIALLDLFIIKRTLPRSLSYVRAFLKPALATVVMGFAAWGSCGLFSKLLVRVSAFQTVTDGMTALSYTGNALATVLAIGIAVVVYAALIVLTRAISADDLALMPKGDKIARVLRIR